VGSTAEKAVRGVAAAGEHLVDQPFFTGVAQDIGLIHDPAAGAKTIVRNVPPMALPLSGLLRHVAQSQDPTIRRPSTIAQGFAANLPGLTQQAPPVVDPFGGIVKRTPGAVTNMLDFTSPRAAHDDPVLQELERIGGGLSGLKQRKGEAVEAFVQRQQQEGRLYRPVIQAAMQSDDYQALRQFEQLLPRLAAEAVRKGQVDAKTAHAQLEQKTEQVHELMRRVVTQAAGGVRGAYTKATAGIP
jgi:hypothetical protein